MNLKVIAIKLGVVCGVVYFATSFALGNSSQAAYDAYIKQFSVLTKLSFENESYTSGIFTSEATTDVQVEALIPDPALRETLPKTITLTHHINHGPIVFPSWAPTTAGTLITTTIVFPDEYKDTVKTVFGKNPPIQVLTTIAFNGAVRVDVVIAEGKYANDMVNSRWSRTRFRAEIGNDYENVSYSFSAPGFLAMGNGGIGAIKVSLEAMKAAGHAIKDTSGLWIGDSTAGFKNLDLEMKNPRGTTRVNAKRAQVASNEVRNNSSLDSSYTFKLYNVNYNGENIGPIEFELQVRNLDISALVEMQKVVGGDFGASFPVAGPEMVSGVQSGLLSVLPKLLGGSPEIEVKRLSFRTSDGESSFKGLVVFLGDPAFNLSEMGADGILSRLRFEADLSVPVRLVQRLATALLSQRKMSEGVRLGEAKRLAAAEAVGVINGIRNGEHVVTENNRFRTSLRYIDGNLTANGNELDATAIGLGGRREETADVSYQNGFMPDERVRGSNN